MLERKQGKAKAKQNTDQLLAGYRALDLTDEKGFFCGKILGDLGTDVIKIERPGGDPSRTIGPFYHNYRNRTGFYWWAFNTNKRGITLNIETEEGQKLFKELVKGADFVIESFEPGYLHNLDLAYEDLNHINTRIIVTSITPFGQTGPKAYLRATELTCWASSAAMYCCGDPDGPPQQLIFPQSYLHGGLEAAAGSLIAHHFREISGQGQHIDVSIQESIMTILEFTQETWAFSGVDTPRPGGGYKYPNLNEGIVMQRYIFPCKDGYILCYSLGGSNTAGVRHLQTLVNWMDEEGYAPEWLKNIDWVHDYETVRLTQKRINEVEEAIQNFLINKTKKELSEEALKRGNLIMCTINTPVDVIENEQLRARDLWKAVEHPELKKTLTYVGPWAKLSESPLKNPHRAPLVAENNEDIYVKELGISQSEIVRLSQKGII